MKRDKVNESELEWEFVQNKQTRAMYYDVLASTQIMLYPARKSRFWVDTNKYSVTFWLELKFSLGFNSERVD